MLSKSRISLLRSLQHKKFRREHGLFLVEGHKSIAEFLQSPYRVEAVFHTPAYASKVLKLSHKINYEEITVSELEKISSMKSPQEALAVLEIPDWPPLRRTDLEGHFTLALDGIQDPGNLGNIIRIADWFGIQRLICSADTADTYNPKVVQACMGSLARVQVHYTDLPQCLAQMQLPVFAALLSGDDLYETEFGGEGIIVMGNEGQGIRRDVAEIPARAVTIPRVGRAESLNVAIAAALFAAEVTRKKRR